MTYQIRVRVSKNIFKVSESVKKAVPVVHYEAIYVTEEFYRNEKYQNIYIGIAVVIYFCFYFLLVSRNITCYGNKKTEKGLLLNPSIVSIEMTPLRWWKTLQDPETPRRITLERTVLFFFFFLLFYTLFQLQGCLGECKSKQGKYTTDTPYLFYSILFYFIILFAACRIVCRHFLS